MSYRGAVMLSWGTWTRTKTNQAQNLAGCQLPNTPSVLLVRAAGVEPADGRFWDGQVCRFPSRPPVRILCAARDLNPELSS